MRFRDIVAAARNGWSRGLRQQRAVAELAALHDQAWGLGQLLIERDRVNGGWEPHEREAALELMCEVCRAAVRAGAVVGH